MQSSPLDTSVLRRLSELRSQPGKVLTLFVNLDPSDFATPQARSSAITSLLDEADRRARDDGLDHDERVALRADIDRARKYLEREFSAKGAHGLALFACGPAGLFEPIPLARPIDFGVVIDDAAWLEPLVGRAGDETLCAALVSRRSARLLCGSRDRLEEVAELQDEVHGRHQQGGWSQPRYERSVEEQVRDHLDRTARMLLRRVKRGALDSLVVGATEELYSTFAERLHPYVREKLLGRFDVDVENTTPDEVAAAAGRLLEAEERRREREALDRLAEGVGSGGRARAGLEATLDALSQRRVETLLYADGFARAGVACPACGYLATGGEDCPVDGTPLAPRDNVLEDAVEVALQQSAETLVVRHHDDLGAHGSVGALLRF